MVVYYTGRRILKSGEEKSMQERGKERGGFHSHKCVHQKNDLFKTVRREGGNCRRGNKKDE